MLSRDTVTAPPLWRVVRDGAGMFHVVNTQMEPVLMGTDPLVRLQNLSLAAAAPWLLHEMRWAVGVLERTVAVSGRARQDAERLAAVRLGLGYVLPPFEEVVQLSRTRQLELPVEDYVRAIDGGDRLRRSSFIREAPTARNVA